MDFNLIAMKSLQMSMIGRQINTNVQYCAEANDE